MGITVSEETTVGELMKHVPGYEQIFKKHMGRTVPKPVLFGIRKLKISQTSARAGWTPDQVNALIKDCNRAIAEAEDHA